MGKGGEEWSDSLEREEGRPARRQQTVVLHTVVSSGENNSLLNLLICVSVPACGSVCSDSDICGTAT